MEIIFINREREIVKIGDNVKIRAMGKHIIGLAGERDIIMDIEEYESEKRAKEVLEKIGEWIKKRVKFGYTAIIIDLKEYEELIVKLKKSEEGESE